MAITTHHDSSVVNEKANIDHHNEYQSDAASDPEKAPAGFRQHEADGNDIPWTATRMIAVAALCMVYVGSQIVLYFVSSNLLPISESIGTKYGNWMLTANTLAVAAICPFVGYITDLLGRRWLCIFGTALLIVASIVQATAQNFAAAVSAQAIGGIGAGICELVALAGYVQSFGGI